MRTPHTSTQLTFYYTFYFLRHDHVAMVQIWWTLAALGIRTLVWLSPPLKPGLPPELVILVQPTGCHETQQTGRGLGE